jgi:hypothetical protein
MAIHTHMPHFTHLKEIEEALEASNTCSEALEKLLQEAKESGSPSPELIERIRTANKQCEMLMDRYVDAYNDYHKKQGAF